MLTLANGQRLFRARGYEAIGLALLTGMLGIQPPRGYTAFGSKAAFFGRVRDRYPAERLTPTFPPHRSTL